MWGSVWEYGKCRDSVERSGGKCVEVCERKCGERCASIRRCGEKWRKVCCRVGGGEKRCGGRCGKVCWGMGDVRGEVSGKAGCPLSSLSRH